MIEPAETVTANAVVTFAGAQGTPDRALRVLSDLGFELGPAQPSTLLRIDTHDGRLAHAGATLDARPVYVPGNHDGVELLPGGALPGKPLVVGRLPRRHTDLPSGQLRFQIGSLVGERALMVQLAVTSSCAHAICRDASGAATVRVELHTDVEVHDGNGVARAVRGAAWCLVMHPLTDASKQPGKVRRRLTAIGLEAADGDVLTWAGDAAGVEPPAPAPARAELGRDATAADAFRTVLHHLGDLIGDTWQGTADDIDAEFLHELRIALRTARSVLHDAQDVLPDGARDDALDLAGALADRTSAPRDLDVHLIEWDDRIAPLGAAQRVALEPVRELLRRQRDDAHRALSQALADEGRDAWLARFRELVDTRRAPDGTRPELARRRVGKVVARRVRRAHRRLVHDGRAVHDDTPLDHLHELRKDAKRLRYLIDSFGSLVPSKTRRRYVRRLKVLQDHLGALQDAHVHHHELLAVRTALLDGAGPSRRDSTAGTAATLEALDVLADELAGRIDELRDGFAAVFAEFDHPRTRRALDDLVERLRR